MNIFGNIPEQTPYALIVGFGSLVLALCLAVLTGNTEKVKRVVEIFSSLVIAAATIALVLVTIKHINEARNMRKTTEEMVVETKRLADISVEQFKIKSYPTITITTKEYSLESDKNIQKFGFSNKGEMTAFNFSGLVINTYKDAMRIKSDDLTFKERLEVYYKIDEEKIALIEYEIKLPKGITRTLIHTNTIKPPYRANHPIHALIIIRFKVPYDTYRYETYSFVLEEEKKWKRMNNEDTDDLLDQYFKKVNNKKALKFLSNNEHSFNYQTRDVWMR